MRPKAFEQLWALAARLARTSHAGRTHGPASTFDCPAVGLILEPNESRYEYSCTPLNADTFATTGIDGVHFNLLLLPDQLPDAYPVVMTVPMADDHNHVVGANMIEFLSLGCRHGFISLDEIAFDRTSAIANLQSGANPDLDGDEDAHLLDAIRSQFGLRPWTDVNRRLNELHEQFHRLIQLTAG